MKRSPVPLATCLSLSCVLFAASAWPSDERPANPDDIPRLEQIDVLGSHIRHVDLETQHPVLVLDRADIQRTGLTSISDILQQIVANGETLNRTHNFDADGGAQKINLRSLGPQRTLVLVNGSRWVQLPDGSVDLSGIPLTMVERVEVLLDSASAIYGSDAIAGVINIITRKDLQGAELDAYLGRTSHEDGTRRAYSVSFGHRAERWSGSAGIEYSKDDPIFSGDRAISAVPIFGLPPGATGSNSGPYTFFSPVSGLGSLPLRLIDGKPGTSPSDFRPVDFSQDLYNYAPPMYLQTPQERRAVFAQGRFEITPSFALSADYLFNQRRSTQQLSSSNISVDITDTGSHDAIPITADNVYNPFGEPIAFAARRLLEAGPRDFNQTDDTQRLHFALDGLFGLFGRDFSWRLDTATTRSNQREYSGPYADNSQLLLALGPSYFDAAGTAHCGTAAVPISACVPLNLFGPPGSITPAMLDYIETFETNRRKGESVDYGAQVNSSDLLDLPAGPLGFAAGVDHRRESGAALLDPLENSGDINGNGVTSSSTSGAYSVNEAYVEFDAPLLADGYLARKLDFVVGSRYSHYSDFGSTTNSQAGLRWKPVDDLLVRANIAQGFRAPAIAELFQGAVQSSSGATDPCDAINAETAPAPAVLARCAALGVPANVNSYTGLATLYQAGNPALKPETSLSRGIGMVYTPSWLDGLDFSLDWYDIRIRNAIGLPDAQVILDDCYVRRSDSACSNVMRRPTDGTIYRVTDLFQNVSGGVETEGYDLALAYRHDTPIGRISGRWNTNYVDYFGEIGKPAQGALLANGTYAQGNVVGLDSPNSTVTSLFGVIWRWRSQAQLIWDRAPWSVSITGRYFSSVDEDCTSVFYAAYVLNEPALQTLCSNPQRFITIGGADVPGHRVPSVTFTDLEGSWDAPWHARITLGVRNAFDRTPPISYASVNSFYPDYDLPGRFWYASYRQTF